MQTVTVRFTSRWPYNPASLAISRLSGSREFSHSMIIIDGMAYEACMFHGCRVVPEAEAMKGIAKYQDMTVPVPNIDMAIVWGRAQRNKGYDYAGAFGIPFLMSEDWSDEDKWWCSEHNFMMLIAGGLFLLDPCELKRITPEDIRMCNYPKSEIIYVNKGNNG